MVDAVKHRSLVASIVTFALGLAVPLVILIAVTTAWYVSTERARLEAVGHLTGNHLRERLDRDLAEMVVMARTLATSPAIDAGDWARFEAQGRALVDVSEFTVSLSDLSGRHIVNTRVAPGGALPTVPRPDLAARLVSGRQPLVSKVVTSPLTGAEIVLVSAPVVRDEAVASYVSIVVRLDHFASLIERHRVAEPFSAAIVDGAGRIVAETGARAAGSSVPVAALARQEAASGTLQDWNAEGSGSLDFFHRSGMSDWTVVTGIDKAAFEAPLRQSLALLAGLALVLVGGGGLVAWTYARRVAAATASLVAAADGIGRGDVVAVDPHHIREARAIGGALNAASRTLDEQRRAIAEASALLEDHVAERSRELEASRAHHQLLAENMTDVVVLRHLRGAPVYVSPSSLRLFGREESTGAGFDPRAHVHPDDLAAFDAVETALGLERPSVVSLFRVRHADGRWIWIEAVNDFLASAGPGEPDVISTLRDVTARCDQADELRMARDSAELAQAKAENASRAKSEFMGLMSHEIRTPLTTIKGFADLLAQTAGLSGDQRRYLGLVAAATETLIGAVDDVLDYARAEAGELRLDLRPVNLPALARDAAALVRPLAEGKGLDLSVAIAPEAPTYVAGDERRLRQILLSILNDAVGPLDHGGVTLSVQGPRRGEAPDRWRIAVTAQAGGEAVWRPASNTASIDGSGLSLIVAQRLVGLMGGRIERATRPGETAAYRFTLTLATAAAPVPAVAAGTGRAARILVTEDSLINQEVVRAMLERAGYCVEMVESGEAAVLAVQASTYDLVLMDVAMPGGMDGIAATRRIRALQHPSRRVPIVAMTANVMPDRVRALVEAGVSGHLAKPFDLATLVDAVTRQLSALVLLDSDEGRVSPTRPPIFDRPCFDALRERVGAEEARNRVRALVLLLDDSGDDPAREPAQAIAADAADLGFLDLSSAYTRLLAVPEAADTGAARGRCHVARDLVHRIVHELTGPAMPEIRQKVALL